MVYCCFAETKYEVFDDAVPLKEGEKLELQYEFFASRESIAKQKEYAKDVKKVYLNFNSNDMSTDYQDGTIDETTVSPDGYCFMSPTKNLPAPYDVIERDQSDSDAIVAFEGFYATNKISSDSVVTISGMQQYTHSLCLSVSVSHLFL